MMKYFKSMSPRIFLTSLPGASEKLEIFNADLNNPESFAAAIEGCIGVFHVATPVDFENKEAEKIVTKRSIDGAMGILNACLDSKTVKKVVYTSSSSAVIANGKDFDQMDEKNAVLEFSEKHGLEVVTLIPSFVVGPFICPKPPCSVLSVLHMVLGERTESSSRLDLVHVDDVARAHIFLFEHSESKGRYNCSSNVTTVEGVFELLAIKYPEIQIPNKGSQFKMKSSKLPRLSSKKLLDSGFEFRYVVVCTISMYQIMFLDMFYFDPSSSLLVPKFFHMSFTLPKANSKCCNFKMLWQSMRRTFWLPPKSTKSITKTEINVQCLTRRSRKRRSIHHRLHRRLPCRHHNGSREQRGGGNSDQMIYRWTTRHLNSVLRFKDSEEISQVMYYVKSLKSNVDSYVITKTPTEMAVVEFSENHGMKVVTLIYR
ncbi:hypothetical protein TIFTF001_012300 [Ficus carica]|uniref:NAD-dependent epimerase/dehydratase domain-containing protein n=1 Tax=Ficus carica TaxID=3494 RepID=A0AA87ZVQ3_FICCA|nr:hypothetical protein TIFTF001_012300 [Ficus carica]